MNFKQMTSAIFVGEPTGGKPNHFGEVRSFQLPTSNLKVKYSTKYFQFTKEEMDTVKPDKLIEPSFEDYQKGIDPVFNWIKKQEVR